VKDYILGGPTLIGYDSDTLPVYSSSPSLIPTFEETPFRDQLDNNLGKSIGFNLSVPIFNNWSTHLVHQACKSYPATNSTWIGHYPEELVQKHSACSYRCFFFLFEIRGRRKKCCRAGGVDEFQPKEYDAGLINTYDYLIAKNNYAKAKADLIRAKYDYVLRIKILDFYMGKPLAF
jgi:outer membrane protein